MLLVIHMSLERERIQETLDTKNTLLLNVIFQIYERHQWDVKLRSWKVHSPPTHTIDLEEWVLISEEYP